MESETAIANAALLLVGAKELTNLDDDTSTAGRIAQRWYVHTRDSLLRRYTWNFALDEDSLSQDATAASTQYANSYTLPTDPYCLRALMMFDSESEWKVRGRKLLTDDGSVTLHYISRVSNTVDFDDLFTDALIYKYAGNIAFPIMRDKVLVRELKAEFKDRISEAITADSMEGTFDRISNEVFLKTRRVGSAIPPTTPPSSAGTPR